MNKVPFSLRTREKKPWTISRQDLGRIWTERLRKTILWRKVATIRRCSKNRKPDSRLPLTWRNTVHPSQPQEPLASNPKYEDPEIESWKRQADFIARILDTMVRIPGTNIWIGLDPLLGLLPGIGDACSHLIGSSLLYIATKIHVPRIIMVRMAINIGLNTIIGAIPGIGDVFSVWFRSNVKNAQLLRRYGQQAHPSSTASDWVFVLGLAIVSLAIMLGSLFLIFWLLFTLYEFFK